MKTSTLECKENEQILKISHQKNANEQKLLLTSKIRKQKKTIKNNRLGEGSGWEASSDRRGKATTRQVLDMNHEFYVCYSQIDTCYIKYE